MRVSRRVFASGSAAAVAGGAILRFGANAAEFTLKWGSDWPAGHPVSIRAVQAASKIHIDSGGRLEVRYFPGSELGTSLGMVQQARAGALEIVAAGFSSLE